MLMKNNIQEIDALKKTSLNIRYKLIQMSNAAKTPHLGSSLSCVDILVAAYWGTMNVNPEKPNEPERDRLILSKGHAATTLYVALAKKGFFSEEILETYAKHGSKLEEHPSPGCVPGVEAAAGSLGHGLPIGLGMALASKIQKKDYRVFVVMSDGECNEGSVWEAAMFAPAKKLDNVVAIIDFNKWQATGRSCETLALQPLKQKWEAFGWSTYEIDGHNLEELVETLKNTPDGSGKPVAIIANTVKGKGVSFMEDDNNWHYRIPTDEEVEKARIELKI